MDIPKIFINNVDGNITKESYVDCKLQISNNGIGSLPKSATIKGRGHSTWMFPKKPYNIKFSKKVNLFGLGKHKKWVLLANWMDNTSMRNIIALELANRIMPNVPKYKYVELYMNDTYQGLYLLCEPIEDFDYLVEFNSVVDVDDVYFETSNFGYKCTVKEPSVTNDSIEFLNIRDSINNIENILVSGDFTELSTKIDIRSFIDYILIQELVGNEELQYPKSTYMYKNGNSKFFAGPVWDFDWGTFITNDNEFSFTKYDKYWWYHKLFQSQEFINQLKLRWNEVKSITSGILQFGNEIKTEISEEVKTNNAMWPIKSVWDDMVAQGFDPYPNGNPELDFETSSQNMLNWFQNRINQMDSLISEL